ncbi:DUF4253 domain-containing protein [Arcicella rosea]|uniref:DUF4253 domain-containing protein n=1 Tax=Arcicella rosea TaxID=502909 RepID=A0A841ERK9_9BACT|nr:DUF4253 domain-containing protein [Arcicella rosea]MBB6003663.1 hypothetical protein [Arcicella rosea]
MELTENEINLANTLDFRISILQTLKNETQNPIHQGIIFDANNEPIGFKNSVLSKSNGNSIEAIKHIRKWLLGSSYIGFISDIQNNELSIIKSKNQFEIINVQETSGVSFELTTDEIVQKLTNWNKQFSINILGANYSWILIEFEKDIDDFSAFYEELLEFCPDLNQIFITEQELISQIKIEKQLLFWWD